MKDILLWSLAPAALLSVFLLMVAGLLLKAERQWHCAGAVFPIFYSLLATTFLFFICEPEFRVLNDETSFLNIAHSLAATGKTNSSQEWIWASGHLQPRNESPSFRPVLFPTLLAVPTFLFGKNPSYGFFLNFFVTAALFTFIFFLNSRNRQLSGGALAVTFLAVNPLFSLTAASAGYDLLALTLGVVTFLLWRSYLKHQGDTEVAAVLFSGAALASTRVEGILPFSILWCFVLPSVISEKKTRSAILCLLSPVLVFPVLLQRFAFYPHIDLKSVKNLVSLSHVLPNATSLLHGFFLSPMGPLPVLIHALGAYFLFTNWRKWLAAQFRPLVYFLGIYLVFLLSFHDGKLELPFQARLFLPFSLVLCLAAAEALICENRKWLRAGFAGVVLMQIAFSYPTMKKGIVFFDPPFINEFRAIKEFVEARGSKVTYLYINPGPISALCRAAIQPKSYDAASSEFHEMIRREKLGPLVLIETIPGQRGSRPDGIEKQKMTLISEVPLQQLRTLRFLELSEIAEPLEPRQE